jgi:hypothetical protein
MKVVKSLMFLAAGIMIFFVPDQIYAYSQTNGDTVWLFGLFCWPVGAALSTFGFVKLIQRDRKPAPGQNALSVLFICGGLIVAWQSWLAFEYMEDANAWVQIVAYAGGAIALIAFGIRKARK